jgi:hypothetical protein
MTFLDVYEMMIAFTCKFGPPYFIYLFMRSSRDKREYNFKVIVFSDDVNDIRNGRNVYIVVEQPAPCAKTTQKTA